MRPSISFVLPAPSDDRGVVLVEDHLLGLPEVLELDVLQLDPEVLRDGLAAGQRGDVLQHGLAAVAEARRLDGGAVQRPAELVHDQGRAPALLVVPRELEIVALARHADDDPTNTGPGIEPRAQRPGRAIVRGRGAPREADSST